jgi:uncharacterized protein
VFRRRHPVPLRERLSRWLWPHIGWRRTGAYLLKRTVRLSGTPHSIAAGVACGAAISFTPFIGFHLLGTLLLVWLVRGNYLAGAIGTLIGNPWTFPFIWVATYKLGLVLLGERAAQMAQVPSGALPPSSPMRRRYSGRWSQAAFLWPSWPASRRISLWCG